MALTYRFYRPFFGPVSDRVIIKSDGVCDGPHWNWEWEDRDDTSKGGRNTDTPAATLAHVGFEIVAQALAAPLRRAWAEHNEQPHGDADPRLPYRAHCAECQRLEALLPEGDRPIAYG